MKLFRWLKKQFSGSLPVSPLCAIPQGQAILCEGCHYFVLIPRYVSVLVGDGMTCPRCQNKKPDTLKIAVAWMRTEEEQRVLLEGRKVKMRTGATLAINAGIPGVLPRKIVRVELPKDAA